MHDSGAACMSVICVKIGDDTRRMKIVACGIVGLSNVQPLACVTSRETDTPRANFHLDQ